MKTLRDIGEDALIQRLISLVPRDGNPRAGPGDDCAVIDEGGDFLKLLKTDALVERVHFLPVASARRVGWKAVARVVSDFAAMGGRSEKFLITLALSPETEIAWVEELYRGIGDCLKLHGGVLAGGETSSVPVGSAAVISVAAMGVVRRAELVLRSTASAGDVIFVTGELGGSIAGKHLDFSPRVLQSAWLVSHCKPSAMMDLSDGLAKDLPRLAMASGCGVVLEEAELPIAPGCTVGQAMGDGEDYELLFTVPTCRAEELLASWPFPEVRLSRIGEMVELGNGQSLLGGWEHFSGLEH